MAGDDALFEQLARLAPPLAERDVSQLLSEAGRLAASRPRLRPRSRPQSRTRPNDRLDSPKYSDTDDISKLTSAGNTADPIVSPKFKNNDVNTRRLNVAQEELKDAKERLKSLQMQYENLAETNKQTKTILDEKFKDNQALELKLLEREEYISSLCRDLEVMRAESSQIVQIRSNLRDEMIRNREEKKNMSNQMNKDRMTIQDLQRQCKEMENILMKRHPDSVSALIVASKQQNLENDTKSLLEKRISDLEAELKSQDDLYQQKLAAIQEKVNSMKVNYETHIADLEKQVISLQMINTELKDHGKSKDCRNCSTQTDLNLVTVAVQTMPWKILSARSRSQTTVTTGNTLQAKEDMHLVATLRGLNLEIAQKDKNISRLNKELEESKKSIVKLQKTKDPVAKVAADKYTIRKPIPRPMSSRIMKPTADAVQSNLNSNKENTVNKQENEKNTLKTELSDLQKDYESLKKKRIDDLVELQTVHEKELMNLNMKVMPLQKNVDTLNSTVETLRDQIKTMDEQLSIIITERDHFKCRVEQLDSKFARAYDSDSDHSEKNGRISNRDYDMLKTKVLELEKRYEGREMRLKTLINSLAKLKDVNTGLAGIEGVAYPESTIGRKRKM